MAIAIIDIDVNDESFKEFQVLFAKYKDQVEGMPAAWRKVTAASDGAANAGSGGGDKTAKAWGRVDAEVKKSSNIFSKFSAIVGGTVTQIDKAKTAQQKFNAVATGTGKTFGVIAKSTATTAGNIKDITLQLLKWASLTTVFAGLAGGGGLFGIARLAQSAAQSRRASQGLGITAGEHEAAKINYEKLVDVDALLARINEVRNDVTKRWAFTAAGLPQSQIEGKSNAEVMKMLIPLLKKTNEQAGGTQQGAQAHGLLEFTDMTTLTRLKAVQQQEIDAATASYDKDKKALAVADQTQAAWQALDAQLRRAGVSIENQFINKLASLTGPITELSDAFAKAVKTFLDSPKIGKWIGDLGTGIETFSKYLVSDRFNKDVDQFLDAVDTFTGALYSAGKTLGKVLGFGSEKTLKASEYRKLEKLEQISPDLAAALQWKMENPTEAAKPRDDSVFKFGKKEELNAMSPKRLSDLADAARKSARGQEVDDLIKGLQQNVARPSGQSASGKIKQLPSNVLPFERKAAAPSNYSDFYKSLENKNGLPAGLLGAVEKKESGGDVNAVGPVTKTGERARGPFQFMAATADQYGVKDVNNRAQAATGAASMFKDLLGKYGGDLPKALAGYNWGQGNLDKYGMEKAPAETRDYVSKIMADMQRSKAPSGNEAATGGSTGRATAAPVIRMPAMPVMGFTINNNTGGNAVVIANQIAQ